MEICKPTNLTISNYPNILEVYYRLDYNEYLLVDRSISLETFWINGPIASINLNEAFRDKLGARTPITHKDWFQYYSYLGRKYNSLDQLVLKHPEVLI